MIKTVKNILYGFYQKSDKLDIAKLSLQIDELRLLQGLTLLNNQKGTHFNDYELKVFSQFGEDGLIQHIINKLNLPEHLHNFVEFGVEDYQESNTRFLLENNNWSGLLFDGSKTNIEFIQNHRKWWKHDLKAKKEFITRENINTLLLENGYCGEIGLLSIDIDGNDYWIWEAITEVEPQIVIVEYNSKYGNEKSLTIPYKSDFQRSKLNNSYYGASISALEFLAQKKGYILIGSNTAGNNAFFVHKKYSSIFLQSNAKEVWKEAKYRENRLDSGELCSIDSNNFFKSIKGLKLVDVKENIEFKVS